ncbi:MAG TPA: phosphoglycerate mutase [Burkholderiaceae bacterium]|nr:phosphoglycerate mutase [Burkholderiaceae bacterium]
MHILIPYASAASPDTDKWVQTVRLPNLNRLLATMRLSHSDVGTEDTYSPPHERALARLQGLPASDGYIPWAAQRAATLGLATAHGAPWCFVTLCHCIVGMNDVQMQNPDLLQITESESQSLFAAMQPFFAEDGLLLHRLDDVPGTFLVNGEPLRGTCTASLDRVIGKNINQWQASGTNSAKLHRLQNEMQMLLYTHSVNAARDRSKAANINSLWFHGNGELAAPAQTAHANVVMPRNLANAAFNDDWMAWTMAWKELDATICADLRHRTNTGEPVTLTLCGERSARSYEIRPKSIINQLTRTFTNVFGLNPAYSLPKVLLNL